MSFNFSIKQGLNNLGDALKTKVAPPPSADSAPPNEVKTPDKVAPSQPKTPEVKPETPQLWHEDPLHNAVHDVTGDIGRFHDSGIKLRDLYQYVNKKKTTEPMQKWLDAVAKDPEERMKEDMSAWDKIKYAFGTNDQRKEVLDNAMKGYLTPRQEEYARLVKERDALLKEMGKYGTMLKDPHAGFLPSGNGKGWFSKENIDAIARLNPVLMKYNEAIDALTPYGKEYQQFYDKLHESDKYNKWQGWNTTKDISNKHWPFMLAAALGIGGTMAARKSRVDWNELEKEAERRKRLAVERLKKNKRKRKANDDFIVQER